MQKNKWLCRLLTLAIACGGCVDSESRTTRDSGSALDPLCARDRNGKLVHRDVDFSCSTDDDCEIKDIRSGCGAYPRCVNSEQSVPAFTCHETTGNCGYPSVEYCKCQEHLCRSMQNDQEI